MNQQALLMANDKDFNLEELLENSSFRKWVFGEKNEDWELFEINNPNKSEIINEAKAILLAIAGDEEDISEEDVDFQSEKIVNLILLGEEKLQTKKLNWNFSFLTTLTGIAAMLIVGITIFWFYSQQDSERLTYENQVKKSEKALTEFINDSEVSKKITLPDGSFVELKKNSRISYPTDFEKDKRDVYLKGEAFFNVVRNPKKPFIVHSRELQTEVLGTSFNVKAYDDDIINVSVKTGKVKVSKLNDEQNGTILEAKIIKLLPNQQAVYSRKGDLFNKKIVEAPEILIKDVPKTLFIYEDVRVIEVLEDLEKFYGIPIVFDKGKLDDCIIRADLSEESMYNKLDIIAKIIEGTYQEIEGQIVINAKGCSQK